MSDVDSAGVYLGVSLEDMGYGSLRKERPVSSILPDAERFGAFANADNPPEPLVMLNLLRYRERAEYPPDFDAAPCSGREAYARYGASSLPFLQAAGARVVWAGHAVASVIAPDAEDWDDVILVEYPTREAFLKMLADPGYQAGVPHRTAALADSRLVAMEAATSALG